MLNTTLFKVNKNLSVQIWKAWVEGSKVISEYGKQDGKQTRSEYEAKPTNVGRSNERNAEQQALFECEAMYADQIDNKHYRKSVEEAEAFHDSCTVPMKVQDYKKHASKITFPCWVQLKFNGSRLCVVDGKFMSKAGREETCKVRHIAREVRQLGMDIDSEVYCHGFSLQAIRSAFLKPNDNTPHLKLMIFDSPKRRVPFSERAKELVRIQKRIEELGLRHLQVEMPVRINTQEELDEFYDKAINQKYAGIKSFLRTSYEHKKAGELVPTKDGGEECFEPYEGIIIRNDNGMFEFGNRSYDTQKRKPRFDSEAKVLEVSKDKSGQGVLHCVTCDSLGAVKFKCKMKVDRRDGKKYPRDYETMLQLIGKWITFSYEELSDKGVPTKPVGELERNCDDQGNPLE